MARRSNAQVSCVLRVALPVIAFAAMGWGAASSTALPAPEELVPNTVVRISDVPDRLGTITRAEFRHALVLAAVAEGHHVAPKPGEPDYRRLKHAALYALLEAVWLKGLAMEMDIVVTRDQIKRERTRIKEESFKSAAEYRKFLRETRYTPRDVYELVELQLLSPRIIERVLEGVRGESEEQKVLREFVTEFNEIWRSRTVCAPGYVTKRCSNGPAEDQVRG